MITIIGTDIKTAAKHLQNNALVAIPTETVYGLAGNALNEDAVFKIYNTKQRPQFNPLILHTFSFEEAHKYVAHFPEVLAKLARAFWPGGLTILLPKANHIPDIITAGSNYVAIRVPNHPTSLALLKMLDFPLAAPSANPSGYVSPTTAKHVNQQLGGLIPYILDGGAATIGVESTIVGLNEHNQLSIFRHGGISAEAIAAIVGPSEQITTATQSTSKPQTAGQLTSHYATRTPLFIGDDINLLPKKMAGKRVLYLRYANYLSHVPQSEQWLLAPDGKDTTAAHNLFGMLRAADDSEFDLILAELAPSTGLGIAINDRLTRAQHHLK